MRAYGIGLPNARQAASTLRKQLTRLAFFSEEDPAGPRHAHHHPNTQGLRQ
jgi:hypothetical protein